LSENYTFRPYKVGDENELIEMLKIDFPNWEKKGASAKEHWKWKYIDSPLKPEVYVAVYGNAVVGLTCEHIINIKIGNSTFPSGYGDDLVIHKDHRGKGIYSRLAKITDKLPSWFFSYWMSENPIVMSRGVRLNNIFPHTLIKTFRIKNIDLELKRNNLNKPHIRLGFTLLKYLNAARNLLKTSVRKNQLDFDIIIVNKFDDSTDRFYDAIKENFNFITEKTKDYLNWRYLDPRSGNYSVKKAVKDDQVLGFIVTELRDMGDHNDGYIVELLTLPNREDVAMELLAQACRDFDGKGVNNIRYMVMKNSTYNKIAEKNGFIKIFNMYRIWIAYRFKDSIQEDLEKMKVSPSTKIYLCSGDFS